MKYWGLQMFTVQYVAKHALLLANSTVVCVQENLHFHKYSKVNAFKTTFVNIL